MAAVGTVVQRFSAPGHLQDFQTQAQRDEWHDFISGLFDSALRGVRVVTDGNGKKYQVHNNAPRPQMFHPAKEQRLPDLTERVISWVGFPKIIKEQYPSDVARWRAADGSRDIQDEYCEWSLRRGDDGKITQVTFTCEGPEYWEFLGKTDPAKVVQLYQQYVDPSVKRGDLFTPAGEYMHRNKWNQNTSTGAMHLIQVNNTLGAEVELAGGSSMVREKDGQLVTDQQQLIRCGRYGAPQRNSDPLIGAVVNELARGNGQLGAKVSLRDPVGLYFDEFRPVGWQTPDGTDATSFWKILRGDADNPVRAVYEVPADKGYVVGDITINGKLIKYAGQIADYVRIKLVGLAQNIGQEPVKKFGCVSYTPLPAAAAGLGVAALAPAALAVAEAADLVVQKYCSCRALPDLRQE